MQIKHPFRLAFISLSILLLAGAIVFSMINIVHSDKYSSVDHLKMIVAPAQRGNIYTYDKELLAVTSLQYELRFDGTYINASNRELQKLANDLAEILTNKSKKEYLIDLKQAKTNKYFLLKRDISLSEIQQIKNIDFYKKPLNGGLIIKQYKIRKKPNLNSAARTIGDLFKDSNNPIYGLEYSYNSDLMGKNGKQLVLYEPGVNRKIKDSNNIKPEAGKDLITTLELSYQDILEQALLRQLEHYEANFGTAILMDVETGQIKAISNLKKTEFNTYAEILNFAVTHQIEPGSTFKMASIMAYLEDFNGSIYDTIDCKNGSYRFKGAKIPTIDHEKLGVVSIKDAFAHSSNIGIARLITKNYNTNPELFINRLYNFGLGDFSKIDLTGVPKPDIKFPTDKSWSGVSLPWISYGYEIRLTPLDILTFYNAIANQGQLVHPYIGYALQQGSVITKLYRDHFKSHRICSDLTVNKIHELLRAVVVDGTAKELNDLPFFVSGKTGTSVKNYGENKNKEYQASFVGFFPSDSPKFSCIVLIDSPNKKRGFYGSQVALPVFKEVAHNIYMKNGLKWDKNIEDNIITLNSSTSDYLHNYKSPIKNSNYYPNVVGMHLRDAVDILEKEGYKIIIKGDIGVVKKQYPKQKTKVKNNIAITLFT